MQDSADALSGSVFVVLGVPGQQFQDSLLAIRQPGKDIGEGAAAVDGELELPLSFGHSEEGEELLLLSADRGKAKRLVVSRTEKNDTSLGAHRQRTTSSFIKSSFPNNVFFLDLQALSWSRASASVNGKENFDNQLIDPVILRG